VEGYRGFLDHLAGQWLLTGTMGDVDLRQEVDAKWILGERFLSMYFNSITAEDNPTSDYEAVYHIGFNEESEIYVMHLLDTTEVPVECTVGRAKREGNSLPFLFEYGDMRFFNVFTWYPEKDRWSFRQSFDEDGDTRLFALKEMVRRSG